MPVFPGVLAACPYDVVVWNPWSAKAQRMADFGDEEYLVMLCVEPGHVDQWRALAPGQTWTLKQTISAL